MNKNIAVKDLKRVVAGINSGGDRGGPPASYIQTIKEIQKVAGEKGAEI
ncbi:hypothetical protein N473_24680 [Pseudoalteromonas luteoviolacea CPMOR-1]|uniref:Uncharacterized protein n=1 Tax=Pseudoalteromonas luteoviolacea CPMOR-1 TaxID=1365248 RepID=A0A167IWW3_9GAMM|nr:hypothetical protein [Pseudoalteromonas luteoviolacea]KZN60178.1 hypothetical protein N473_24680 [Pseudoalteromonas luteoviolacea CPMOR-1]